MRMRGNHTARILCRQAKTPGAQHGSTSARIQKNSSVQTTTDLKANMRLNPRSNNPSVLLILSELPTSRCHQYAELQGFLRPEAPVLVHATAIDVRIKCSGVMEEVVPWPECRGNG